jgi:hypothetical protein
LVLFVFQRIWYAAFLDAPRIDATRHGKADARRTTCHARHARRRSAATMNFRSFIMELKQWDSSARTHA